MADCNVELSVDNPQYEQGSQKIFFVLSRKSNYKFISNQSTFLPIQRLIINYVFVQLTLESENQSDNDRPHANETKFCLPTDHGLYSRALAERRSVIFVLAARQCNTGKRDYVRPGDGTRFHRRYSRSRLYRCQSQDGASSAATHGQNSTSDHGENRSFRRASRHNGLHAGRLLDYFE